METGRYPGLIAALDRGAAAGPEALVAACALEAGGRIPHALRARVYAAILGVQLIGGEQLSATVAATALDLSNQRVLRVDCERTRQELEPFRSDEVKARLARILAFFCKCQMTPYRQGLNEVVAPVMTLSTCGTADPSELGNLSDGVVYSLLQRLVSTFLPAAYGADDEFVGLQCALQYVRVLLNFHDPSLARILDQNSVTPELFATPWLITLLARGHRLPVVFEVWDSLVLHLAVPRSPRPAKGGRDPAEPRAEARQGMPHAGVNVGPGLLHFLCVAMIMRHRDAIEANVAAAGGDGSGEEHVRGLQMAELSMLVSRLSLETPEDGEALVRSAVALAAATPDSVRAHLLEVAYAQDPPPAEALAELEASVCARVSPDEALMRAADAATIAAAASGVAPDDGPASPGPPPLLVIDCRPEADFASCCVRGSFHLDPSVLLDPAMLTTMADAFASMTGLHFAVLGGGSHAELSARHGGPAAAEPDGAAPDVDSAHIVVLFLLNRGFRHVCEVRGGFAAVEAAVARRPALARCLQREAGSSGAAGDGDGADDGPSYDDGSDREGSDESDGGAGVAAGGPTEQRGGSRAARLLRRLGRRSRAASASAEAGSALPPPPIVAASPLRRSRAGSSGFAGLRTWLAGRAAPTEVFYTSEGSVGTPVESGASSVGPLSDAGAPDEPAPAAPAAAGGGEVVPTGLFTGLRLARSRRETSTGGASIASAGAASEASGRGNGDVPASSLEPAGLGHEMITDDEAIDAQLDAIVARSARAPAPPGGLAASPGTTPVAAAPADTPATRTGSIVRPAAEPKSGAGSTTTEGRHAPAESLRSRVSGWRSALGTAAASVASMAASRRGPGSDSLGAAPPKASSAEAAATAAGTSFAAADEAADLLDTRLSLVFKGARAAASPEGDPGVALGKRGAGFYSMRLVKVAEMDGEGVHRGAVVDADGEWCALPADGLETMARVIGCRRVFADKRVERRVLLLTRRWVCLLVPIEGPGAPEPAPAAAPKPRGLLSSLASRAMKAAAQVVSLQPQIHFQLDEVASLACLRKMGGKKGVADLAILDLHEPAHNAEGAAASQRLVLLCDDVKELVAGVRDFRK